MPPKWWDTFLGQPREVRDPDVRGIDNQIIDRSLDRLRRDLEVPPFEGERSGGTDIAVGVAALHATDPGFRAQHFVAGLEGAFLLLQHAWVTGDAGVTVIDAMSPTFLPQWEAMAAQWRTASAPVIFDTTEPPWIRLSSVVVDSNFAQIKARISATAPPSAGVAEFRHIWSLIRYTADSGKVRTTCFNCGAPFAAGRVGECRFCHATLEASAFDWRINGIEDDTDLPWKWNVPGGNVD